MNNRKDTRNVKTHDIFATIVVLLLLLFIGMSVYLVLKESDRMKDERCTTLKSKGISSSECEG